MHFFFIKYSTFDYLDNSIDYFHISVWIYTLSLK